MTGRKTITVGLDTYSLTVSSRYYQQLVSLLPKNEMGEQFALFESLTGLVTNIVPLTVPFLWAIKQNADRGRKVEFDEAYDFYDELVALGYTVDDLVQIVLDMLEASGFFPPTQTEVLRKLTEASNKEMKQVCDEVTEQVPTKASKKSLPKATKLQ